MQKEKNTYLCINFMYMVVCSRLVVHSVGWSFVQRVSTLSTFRVHKMARTNYSLCTTTDSISKIPINKDKITTDTQASSRQYYMCLYRAMVVAVMPTVAAISRFRSLHISYIPMKILSITYNINNNWCVLPLLHK